MSSGAKLIVEVSNDPRSIQLAETVLAALESLFATSLNERIAPYRQRLKLTVEPETNTAEFGTYRVQERSGEPVVEIRHSSSGRSPSTLKEQTKFRDWLWSLLVDALRLMIVVGDPNAYFERIIKQERVQADLSVADMSIAVKNILGDHPSFRLTDWKSEQLQSFRLKRLRQWDDDGESKPEKEFDHVDQLQSGVGEAPLEMRNSENIKHRERRVASLIDILLWERARWAMTIYAWTEDPDAPPLIALGFKDEEAGKEIFQGWLNRLGRVDENDELRVSIVTDIDKKNPLSYKVVVGTNPRID